MFRPRTACPVLARSRLLRRLALVALIGLGELVPAAVPAEEFTTTVSYVTRSTIYVDAGTDQGLSRGSALEVRRDGRTVARLTVTALSSRRAACAAPEGHEVRLGDVVAYQGATPAPPSGSPPPIDAVPAPLHLPRSSRGGAARLPGRWSGRMGFRFMARADAMEHGTDLVQPALDLRATATEFGRTDLSLEIDVRTRRTIRSSSSGRSDGRTRVYRSAAAWQRPGSPWTVTAGRQLFTSVASIGTIDGVALEYRGRRWSTGALTGTEPHPATYGFSPAIQQHGVYVARSSAPGAEARWRLALAAIGMYEDGTVRREHLALQGRWSRARLFATVLQDVDVNRSWRAEAEPTLSLTSTFWTTRFRWTDSFSLHAGFDARRNVRTERDTVTPETEFDDSYRRGSWGGFTIAPRPGIRLSLDGRRSEGGSGGVAHSGTARIRLVARRWRGATLSSRHTLFENVRTVGLLQSVSTGLDLTSRVRFGTTGGWRRETVSSGGPATTESSNDAVWWSTEVQMVLARGWYVLGEVEHTAGDQEDNTMFYLSAIRRFRAP